MWLVSEGDRSELRDGDCLLGPAQAFAKVAPQKPEAPQGAGHTQTLLGIPHLQDAPERCPQVVMLGFQAIEPLALRGAHEVRLSLFCQGRVVPRVPSTDVKSIILRRQSVACKLA